VVDRFLKPSRVFAFGPDERATVYLSSADWMPRNFFRRVEVLVPVEDARLRQRGLDEVLGLTLRGTVKARWLQADGTSIRPPQTGEPLRSQMAVLEAVRRARNEADDAKRRRAGALAAPGPGPEGR
jgi:polyphosphate kinase